MSGSDLLSLTKARTAAIAIVRRMVSASTSIFFLDGRGGWAKRKRRMGRGRNRGREREKRKQRSDEITKEIK